MLWRVRSVSAKWEEDDAIRIFSQLEWGSGERESAETPKNKPRIRVPILYDDEAYHTISKSGGIRRNTTCKLRL